MPFFLANCQKNDKNDKNNTLQIGLKRIKMNVKNSNHNNNNGLKRVQWMYNTVYQVKIVWFEWFEQFIMVQYGNATIM